MGWLDFEIWIRFEDNLRFQAWLLPAPRTVVNFDAILDRVDEDGNVHCFLRRIVAIEPASPALLAALKNEKVAINDRASLILQARNKKRPRPEEAAPTAAESNEDTTVKDAALAPTIPAAETPTKGRKDELSVPNAPKIVRGGHNTETPPSPSPNPAPKRGRRD
ncbi:hypothetical protein A4X13_0g4530 [Tilletia indica]|uniref:Uncharacterized protein n=1 Tax=Tilletia indica TaxID=43049 RepID=A0A8T8SYL3_9BASI|nr:hypothetical protein A4X13_0g4530 [Tilletia indica]